MPLNFLGMNNEICFSNFGKSVITVRIICVVLPRWHSDPRCVADALTFMWTLKPGRIRPHLVAALLAFSTPREAPAPCLRAQSHYLLSQFRRSLPDTTRVAQICWYKNEKQLSI